MTSGKNDSTKEEQEQRVLLLNDIILPHLALILTPILASINAVLGRAAFTIYDETKGEEPLQPITYLAVRMVISVSVFVLIKSMGWFGSGNDDEKEKEIQQEKDKEKQNESDSSTVENSQPQQQEEMTNSSTVIKISGSQAADPLKEGPTFIHIASAVVVGAIGTAVNNLFYFYGVQLTSGVTVGSFMALVPGCTFVISYLRGTEGFSWTKFFMTVFVFLGNVFLSQLWLLFRPSTHSGVAAAHQSNNYSSNISSINNNENIFSEGGGASDDITVHDSSYYLGVVALIIGTICFSSYLVLQKPLLPKFHYVDFMLIVQISGLFTVLIVTLFPRENIVTSQVFGGKLNYLAWSSILFGGLVQGSFNWFLMSFGINKCQSVLFVALVLNSAPLFVILESMIFLGETMNDNEKIGVAIIVIGIGIAIYSSVMDKWQSMKKEEEEKKSNENSKK